MQKNHPSFKVGVIYVFNDSRPKKMTKKVINKNRYLGVLLLYLSENIRRRAAPSGKRPL